MAIPISIENLLDEHVVEYARIELKEGWNPEPILHTLCAFANDIDNWGGGYIVIGVAEQDGRPMRPVKGLAPDSLDGIQKSLLALCHKIRPFYAPVCEPVMYHGAHLLLIWAPGGYDRPYRAPVDCQGKASAAVCYVRRFSSTVRASDSETNELIELAGRAPFDDRANLQASLADLRLGYIEEYLRTVGSSLADGAATRPIEALADDLRIVGGPPEARRPLNVGLMMFNEEPEDFFRCARIEVVVIPDPTGEGMTERTFTGPLDRQLSDALAYIRNSVIAERVFKIAGDERAVRVFNYPYAAVEEALSNAVYHKSYQIPEPITVRVEAERMVITSCPGPDRSISDDDLRELHLVSSRYRNRRIGDFLKELRLVEGRNTGVPTMVKALAANGSNPPRFETDVDRTFFSTVLEISDAFFGKPATGAGPGTNEHGGGKPRRTMGQLKQAVLDILPDEGMSQREIARALGYRSVSQQLRMAIGELAKEGLVGYPVSGESPKGRLRRL
jgi:ATP-dependent DNA helicase RecG